MQKKITFLIAGVLLLTLSNQIVAQDAEQKANPASQAEAQAVQDKKTAEATMEGAAGAKAEAPAVNVELPAVKAELPSWDHQMLTRELVARLKEDRRLEIEVARADDKLKSDDDRKLGFRITAGVAGLLAGTGLFAGALTFILAAAGAGYTFLTPATLLLAAGVLAGLTLLFFHLMHEAEDDREQSRKDHDNLLSKKFQNEEKIRELEGKLGV